MNPTKHTWTLWFHKIDDDNWSLASYSKLCTLTSLRDFHALFNTLENYTAGMFFLMKDDIPPLWEDRRNVKGGIWSFKFHKNEVGAIWQKLVAACVGETLHLDMSMINGISISPKLENCIIKIWSADFREAKTEGLTREIDSLVPANALYRPSKA